MATLMDSVAFRFHGLHPQRIRRENALRRTSSFCLADEHTVAFRYRNKGNLATIGRYKAVADFGSFRVVGWIAWWFWLFVHIMYLVGFRNRASVLLQWAYSYFTYQRGVRLITHADTEREQRSMTTA